MRYCDAIEAEIHTGQLLKITIGITLDGFRIVVAAYEQEDVLKLGSAYWINR